MNPSFGVRRRWCGAASDRKRRPRSRYPRAARNAVRVRQMRPHRDERHLADGDVRPRVQCERAPVRCANRALSRAAELESPVRTSLVDGCHGKNLFRPRKCFAAARRSEDGVDGGCCVGLQGHANAAETDAAAIRRWSIAPPNRWNAEELERGCQGLRGSPRGAATAVPPDTNQSWWDVRVTATCRRRRASSVIG